MLKQSIPHSEIDLQSSPMELMKTNIFSVRITVITFTLILIASCAQAQDTIFFDYQMKEIKSMLGARYYQITDKDSADASKTVVRKYMRPKVLLEETRYSDLKNKVMDGIYRNYYETTQLHSVIPYKNGKIDGELITYWGNGELKRKDKYENGKFISGHIQNTHGKDLPYIDYIILPRYKKGEEKMNKYIQDNLIYPEEAQTKKISGTVQVMFTINSKGVVKDVSILKGVSPELDTEAKRVIWNMPPWKPGMVDGMPVEMPMVLPVKFVVSN